MNDGVKQTNVKLMWALLFLATSHAMMLPSYFPNAIIFCYKENIDQTCIHVTAITLSVICIAFKNVWHKNKKHRHYGESSTHLELGCAQWRIRKFCSLREECSCNFTTDPEELMFVVMPGRRQCFLQEFGVWNCTNMTKGFRKCPIVRCSGAHQARGLKSVSSEHQWRLNFLHATTSIAFCAQM